MRIALHGVEKTLSYLRSAIATGDTVPTVQKAAPVLPALRYGSGEIGAVLSGVRDANPAYQSAETI